MFPIHTLPSTPSFHTFYSRVDAYAPYIPHSYPSIHTLHSHTLYSRVDARARLIFPIHILLSTPSIHTLDSRMGARALLIFPIHTRQFTPSFHTFYSRVDARARLLFPIHTICPHTIYTLYAGRFSCSPCIPHSHSLFTDGLYAKVARAHTQKERIPGGA